MTTVLAFDFGLQRTGVAVGQTITQTAQAAGQIKAKQGQLDWLKLDETLQKWQPTSIVIGDPKSSDPHLNKLINRFKSYIQQQHKLPIIVIDEELTSNSANAELADLKLTTDKKVKLRDQIAACLILESYFHQQGSLNSDQD
ncbi:MAG: Holliday junction resolvase RuvX [Acidiferrobacterales bacterium]|nr:Holliday junction resolvase RuvX [Acidiferrobacterales bacterium]